LRGTVPPLVEFRGAPRTQIASTWAGHRFRPARSAFQRPAGLRSTRPPMRRKPHGGPSTLSHSFRGIHRRPARSRRPVGRPVGPRFLSWASLPYDTLSEDPCLPTAVPSAALGDRVRGLATSLTISTGLPTGARSAGASLGFPLQGLFPVCGASSSRSRCPPGVVGPCVAPWGAHRNAIASRALLSTQVRTVIGPWGTDRRCPPGVHPLRAFSPSVRARRFGRAASPSTPYPS